MRTIERMLWEIACSPNEEHEEAVVQDLSEEEFLGLVTFASGLDPQGACDGYLIRMVDREMERRVAEEEARA